ncbi:hypothetical protein ABZ345_02375 [Lentzea sp. NPDC005914]|uniref:hypothetical protein n=1 Tax=Lentzea sp. NPDC005914 TaxID=3154572 RepID=UPI0033D02635
MRKLVKSGGVAVIGAALALAGTVLATPANASDVGITVESPEALCGSGYTRAASHAISGATVYLSKASNNRKCVTTIKTASRGTATRTAAWIGQAAIDDGFYRYYAGPVRVPAPCVIWGGRHGNSVWESPTPYCG